MPRKLKYRSDGIVVPEPEKLDGSLESELADLEERSKKGEFKTLLEQVQAEYGVAYDYMKPKWDEWKARLKMYNNQRRDKSSVGDPLMFTTHQTILAALYNDELSVSFEPNELGDVDTADSLNVLAPFDHVKMDKDIVDYEWDWDASFFGRGLLLMRDFDRNKKLPIPINLNPLVCLRDPRAQSVNGNLRGKNGARFFGWESLMTKGEMKDSGVYFNLNNIGKGVTDPNDIVREAREIRADAQGFGSTDAKTLVGENVEYRILEWYTVWRGQRVFVCLSDDRKKIVRLNVIKSTIPGQKIAPIPVLDRVLYPMSHDWDGVSIPDLLEDKQRARAVVLNLAVKGVKMSLHPMYMYDSNRVRSRSDLDFQFNKHIPVDGDPNNAVVPIQRKQLGAEVDYVFNVLDVAAQRAVAAPSQQQGIVDPKKRTATEINKISAGVDTRYSLSARIFGWSEKRFWMQWYSLYKQHFAKDIDEKVVRIQGALGVRFRPFTRENIIGTVDPDVTVKSKAVADNERFIKLQAYQNWLGLVLSDPTANKRYALRQVGRLSGLSAEDISHILPDSIHELKAKDENDMLNTNEMVEVDVTDDDFVHMQEHNKATDTPAKYAHIEAHKRALMFKLRNPQYDQRQIESAGAQPQEELLGPTAQPTPTGGSNSIPSQTTIPTQGA